MGERGGREREREVKYELMCGGGVGGGMGGGLWNLGKVVF